jgi:hypothetical protein
MSLSTFGVRPQNLEVALQKGSSSFENDGGGNVLGVFSQSSNRLMILPPRPIVRTDGELHLSIGYFGSILPKTLERLAKAYAYQGRPISMAGFV